MIKVNLAKTKLTSTGIDDVGEFVQKKPRIDYANLLVKSAFIFGLTIGLAVYEHIHIASLEKESTDLAKRSGDLLQELQKKQATTAPLKDFELKAKELEDKLTVLKKLSRLRLRAVKDLDFLQTSLPDRVWFSSVKFNDNLIHLVGYAASDDDLNLLTKSLENSILFSNILVERLEVAKVGGTEYKNFEMGFNSEVGE